MKTVALFGGSFDPPHVAHVLAATYLVSAGPIDAVYVLPTWRHPFGKQSNAFEHRAAMCRCAFQFLERAGVDSQMHPVERDVQGATIDVVRELQRREPAVQFRIVMGSDLLPDREKWKEWAELLRLAPPIVLRRPGHPVHPAFEAAELPLELPDISSSHLRHLLRSGLSTAGLLPHAVAQYITANGLYVND